MLCVCGALLTAGCDKKEEMSEIPSPTVTVELSEETKKMMAGETVSQESAVTTPEAEAISGGTATPTDAPAATVTSAALSDEELLREATVIAQTDAFYDFGNGSKMGQMAVEITCPTTYQVKKVDVEYGKIVRTSYYSTTCEKDRNVMVLLPDGYTEEKEYPVLYVLHGIFGNETSMLGDGNSGLRVTVGNLMAKGLAEDMILVFPYMYASKTKDACTAIDAENMAAYDNFINDLVTDLMPFMKETYSVAEGKENTAIIGFSMGGRESLAIGFARPDLFGYVGAIAPAPGLTPGQDWATVHPGQYAEEELVFTEESPYLLMICSGDKDSVVGTFPLSYHNILLTNQVDHIWWEIPGSDHGEPAITSGIYNFCKTIFKDN